jgi:hypothetical protein
MAEFSSYEPERVEVVGEVIESFVLGFPESIRDFGLTALDKHGIRDLDPNRFYMAQPFLNAMRDVAHRIGRNMMTRIGEQIATRVELPPAWDSLEAALGGLDKAYHSKYNSAEIGNWKYLHHGRVGGLARGTMVSTNHYCCTFDRGVLEGFAKRFRPTGITDALVRHDDAQPCRKNGADSCTYIITWG